MVINFKIGVVVYAAIMMQSLFTIKYLYTKGRKTLTLYSHLSCHVLAFLWLLFGVFEMFAINVEQLWLPTKLAFLPICFFGSCWLIFCLSHTESKLIYNKYLIAFLLILSSLFYISVLTTEHHHLFIYSLNINKSNVWGILFYLSASQNYICILLGVIILLIYSLKQHKRLKMQFILIVFSASIPLILNILSGTGIIPSPGFDLVPASFSISLTLCAIAIFKYRFLDITHIALREIVSSMKESVMVIDNYNNIVDFNNSFNIAFGNYIDISRKDNANIFLEKLGVFLNNTEEVEKMLAAVNIENKDNFESEVSIAQWEDTTYFLYIKPVLDKKNKMIGKIISFNDITSYKKLVNELKEINIEKTDMNEELTAMNEELTAMNEELTALNEQLKDYSETAEELAIARERNRFSKDAHDTLGHTMTILIALLEMAKANCETESGLVKERLSEAINVSKDGLKELRRTISGLAPQRLKMESLVNSLKNLIANFSASGMRVDFSVQGVEKFCSDLHSDTIYKLCQEALTNSLRHGKARNVTIILKFNNKALRLHIFDDGKGCKKIQKGFGIAGMEERVNALGGNIIYGSDGTRGFNINVEIPLEANSNL